RSARIICVSAFSRQEEDVRKIATASPFAMLVLGSTVLLAACGHADTQAAAAPAPKYTLADLNEQLVLATLWVQTSSEYRALCYQAYNLAKMLVDQDLAQVKTDKKRIIIVDG